MTKVGYLVKTRVAAASRHKTTRRDAQMGTQSLREIRTPRPRGPNSPVKPSVTTSAMGTGHPSSCPRLRLSELAPVRQRLSDLLNDHQGDGSASAGEARSNLDDDPGRTA